MKQFLIIFIIALGFATSFAQNIGANVHTDDIDHWWAAYDKIVATTDSAQQFKFLDQLFLSVGTPGLSAMREARHYTPQQYIQAINRYPKFWQSIRANTIKANRYAKAISAAVHRLQKLYPALKPAEIYFTMGAFRSGGTTVNHQVLIGCETALADSTTVTSELPASLSHLKTVFQQNNAEHLIFTNVHEYVHTQQKTTVCNTLLGQCLAEGVAEFVTEKALNRSSTLPAIAYGRQHQKRISDVFAQQAFTPDNLFWLYSNEPNEFNQRDLGYYVGYAIAENYYRKARDKKAAIKTMIELDYNDEGALSKFTDQSGYFTQPMANLRKQFDLGRPRVISVDEIADGKVLSPDSTKQITVRFSAPMHRYHRGFELGPAGLPQLMRVKRFIGFSPDGLSVTFEVDTLQPNRQYQLLLSDRFMSANGQPMHPYLIEFKTGQ